MHHLHSKPWLAVECAVLMMGLPLVLYWILPIRYLLPVIWATALLCHLTYRALTRQSTRDWWNRAAVTRTNLRPILQRFAVSALLMAGATWLCAPQLLFGMVRENPAFWLLVMLLYPLLSVVPQEIIFRSFFFARYRTIFTRPPVMVAAQCSHRPIVAMARWRWPRLSTRSTAISSSRWDWGATSTTAQWCWCRRPNTPYRRTPSRRDAGCVRRDYASGRRDK